MKINQARMLHTVFHYASFIWISSIYFRLVLSLQILHPPLKCLNFDEKEQGTSSDSKQCKIMIIISVYDV
jgi:hypothetical protein